MCSYLCSVCITGAEHDVHAHIIYFLSVNEHSYAFILFTNKIIWLNMYISSIHGRKQSLSGLHKRSGVRNMMTQIYLPLPSFAAPIGDALV